MPRLKQLFLLVCMCVMTVPANASETALPRPFTATYSLHSMGTRFANMTRRFSRDEDGKYRYRSETKTAGLFAMIRKDHIVEESVWHVDSGQIKPLHYSYIHTGGKKNRDVIINFDWAGRNITNTVNGSSWHMPIQAYIMDKLLYQLAIMHDLENGQESVSYTIADGGKIKTYDFKLIRRETVETPMGQFDALVLERHKPGSERKTTIWCAVELGYMPVKVDNIENSGRRTMAVIETLTNDPSPGPDI